MERIAIDVALLPSDSMMDLAIEINRELLSHAGGGIELSKEHCLPHITLAMGCIDEQDVSQVCGLLDVTVKEFGEITLTAEKIRSTTISTGETVSEIVIENNADLQRLHETIMRRLRPHMTYDVDVSMLFNPHEVEETSVQWIKGYARKHEDSSLFHPHITVGFGSIEKCDFPLTFSAKKLGLCQLGSYCTCRKMLAEFELANSQ